MRSSGGVPGSVRDADTWPALGGCSRRYSISLPRPPTAGPLKRIMPPLAHPAMILQVVAWALPE